MEFYQRATMKMMSSEFIPSAPFHIEFKFEFEFITSSWIRYAGSTADEFAGESSWEDSSSTAVSGGDALSYDDVLEAVREAIEARVPHEDCVGLVDLVMEGVSMSYDQYISQRRQHGSVQFRVRICVVESTIVTVYDNGVVPPAAESSIGMLDKYEVGNGATSFGDAGRCCSVCLDDDEFVGGGALLRMPCLHVFHGGCIKELGVAEAATRLN